ncbi:MAG: ParB N-terminal domain-containing protein [Chloroflexi bacterium]|nr:ParB N-terminal domain-containing protein [Chloroflexota bacterium]
MNCRIVDIQRGGRARQRMGDITALAASIERVGLLHPVVITPENRLIAGERRILAYEQLGRDSIPVTVIDIENIVRGEADENAARKSLTPSEIVAIDAAVREEEEKLAKGRQGTRTDLELSGKLPPSKSRDRVAAGLGISGRQLEKIRAIDEAKDEHPAIFERMEESGKVDGAYRELKRQQTWKEKTALAPPSGTYRTIVIDPPWRYTKQSNADDHRAALPYPDMSTEELAELAIPAAEDCFLWLWTTNAFMHDAFHLLGAWGFTYRTMLTWAKDRWGTGDWLRGQTEHCLLATRGVLRLQAANASTLLAAKRGAHSEKPVAFYELVERLCPEPRINMFARSGREGWEAWGNEA